MLSIPRRRATHKHLKQVLARAHVYARSGHHADGAHSQLTTARPVRIFRRQGGSAHRRQGGSCSSISDPSPRPLTTALSLCWWQKTLPLLTPPPCAPLTLRSRRLSGTTFKPTPHSIKMRPMQFKNGTIVSFYDPKCCICDTKTLPLRTIRT